MKKEQWITEYDSIDIFKIYQLILALILAKKRRKQNDSL